MQVSNCQKQISGSYSTRPGAREGQPSWKGKEFIYGHH